MVGELFVWFVGLSVVVLVIAFIGDVLAPLGKAFNRFLGYK